MLADEVKFGSGLRRLRRREMLRIAWRDIAGTATLHQRCARRPGFAEAVIAGATTLPKRRWCSATARCPRHGAGLVVLGMGKLGGGELNFSSDIDLVFLFPGTRARPMAARRALNEEYFTRLGRLLIRLLDA